MSATDHPRGLPLLIGTFALGIVIHLLHEAAHALSAMAFGVSGTMGTNTVRLTSEVGEMAAIASTAAGPGLMLIFAIAAFASRWCWAPSVLFIVFIQRAFAAIVSAIMAPNDEARLGAMLGVGPWAVFVLAVGLTGFLFIRRYRAERLGWKWLAISYVGFSLAITLVVFGDDVLPRIAF